MIEEKDGGKRLVIDIRERVKNGEHPREETLNHVREAKPGTIIEIHAPHYPRPLVVGMEAMGYNVVVNELDKEHFRLMTVKG